MLFDAKHAHSVRCEKYDASNTTDYLPRRPCLRQATHMGSQEANVKTIEADAVQQVVIVTHRIEE